MRIITIICSYNTSEMTDRVVKELLKGKKHEIIVLDNSSTEEQVYKNNDIEVIDLGRENIGFGGMHDYIFKEPRFREYDFVGIFNNDIYDIPKNYFETIEKNLSLEDGIVSSAIKKEGSGWEQMWKIHQEGKRQVFHIEDIACYFNTKLFKKFSDFCPYHFYGIQDIVESEVAKKEGYKLYVIDDIEIGHMLAGAREKAGVKDEYLRNSSESLNNWLEKNPEIKELYHNYINQISKKVCVIIPNYNHNHLLRRAIQSVLDNKTKCDIIVVDDCSDEEPDLEGLPVRYLRHDKNRGLAATRNMAICGTKAKYILPLDADDELLPEVIDRLVERAETCEDDIIYGNLLWRGDMSKLVPNNGNPVTMEQFYVNNQILGSSLYRRDFWKSVGGYWEKREHYEDWDFWGRCCKNGAKFNYINLDIYIYGGDQDGMCARLGREREKNVKNCVEHIKNYEVGSSNIGL